MAKKTGETRQPGLRVRIDLVFHGRRFGRLELDKRALEGAIRDSFPPLSEEGYALQLYLAGGVKGKVKQLNRPRVCAKHVSGRIEEIYRGVVEREVVNWIHSQHSDEDFLRELEIGASSLEFQAFRDFVDRIAEYGTTDERRRVAQALRKHLVRVRGGPWKAILPSHMKWIQKNLAGLRAAVKAARGGRLDEPDFEPLTNLLRKLFPGRSLIHLVRKAATSRPQDTVALIVGEKLGVGRDKAQQIIKAAADNPR